MDSGIPPLTVIMSGTPNEHMKKDPDVARQSIDLSATTTTQSNPFFPPSDSTSLSLPLQLQLPLPLATSSLATATSAPLLAPSSIVSTAAPNYTTTSFTTTFSNTDHHISDPTTPAAFSGTVDPSRAMRSIQQLGKTSTFDSFFSMNLQSSAPVTTASVAAADLPSAPMPIPDYLRIPSNLSFPEQRKLGMGYPQNLQTNVAQDLIAGSALPLNAFPIPQHQPHIQLQQQHKFRSPSLPVNSLNNNSLELPSHLKQLSTEEVFKLLNSSASSSGRSSSPPASPSTDISSPTTLHSEAPLLENSTLVIDVRPFSKYNEARLFNAINICIPTTLLKRPAYGVERFSECMIQGQRHAIENLHSYKHIILYDQDTLYIGPETPANSLSFTLVKFGRSSSFTGTLSYLKGGLTAWVEKYPELVDTSGIAMDTQGESCGTTNSTGGHQLGHGHSNSQPLTTMSLSTKPIFTSFPAPLLAGFSLPDSATIEGPMKPFASNLQNSLEAIDTEKPASPLNLPSDLRTPEVESYFPVWLQDIIKKESGPRNVRRRFKDIEEAENVRIKRVFNGAIESSGGSGNAMKSAMKLNETVLSPITPDGSGVRYSFSAAVEKGTKNRYNNIWPYDHTRVKLPGTVDTPVQVAPETTHKKPHNSDCDYINASYITARGTPIRYIATQGPLPDTFNDFWHVVWDKRIPVIVMLTAVDEGGVIKCHKYWTPQMYGPLKLELVEEKSVTLTEQTGTRVALRVFRLIGPDGHAHKVSQVQYTDWPDLGSPASPEDLIALCELKNRLIKDSIDSSIRNEGQLSYMQDKDQLVPWTLVHCSAGCGRTGTFCTVDSVISILENEFLKSKGTPFHNLLVRSNSQRSTKVNGRNRALSDLKEPKEDLFETKDLVYRTVHNFRRQRLSMVQVLRQYILCYETVILWVHQKYKSTNRVPTE